MKSICAYDKETILNPQLKIPTSFDDIRGMSKALYKAIKKRTAINDRGDSLTISLKMLRVLLYQCDIHSFTACSQPLWSRTKKKRKSPLSPSVVFFLSVKNQPTILLQKKHTIYMAETHPPIKKFTRSKNNDMLLLLVSSTANVAQLKQRETSGFFSYPSLVFSEPSG